MLLDHIEIPKVFKFYTHCAGYDTTEYASEIHYCPECGCSFSALWPVRTNLGGRYIDDLHVFCPKCGNEYYTRVLGKDMKYVGNHEHEPLNMELELESFNYGYRLSASGTEITPGADRRMWYERYYTERIFFDINKRKTVFKKYINGSLQSEHELGNPFDITFRNESNLTDLFGRPGLGAYRQRFTKLMEKLRKGIEKGLSKKIGYKIKSMYRSHGAQYGPFIIPIVNIAYRMICIDAPNLSNRVLRILYPCLRNDAAPLYCPNVKGLSTASLDLIRKEKNTISAFIKLAKLPDKRIFRKILTEEPFDFLLLAGIYKHVTKNIDNVTAVYKHCLTPFNTGYSINYPRADYILDNAKTIGRYYSSDDILKLFKHSNRDYEFNDTAHMLEVMSDKVKEKFMTVKPSILSAHDWLSAEQWKETHKIVPFDIDNPLCKRLAMQSDRIKFFLPGTSLDLHEAGKKLRNCVGSYTDKVMDKRSQIVLVSDDRGKLVVCIEVSANRLIQAKLFGNKPVSADETLNAEVIAWAQKTGVDWFGCTDVKQSALTKNVSTPIAV